MKLRDYFGLAVIAALCVSADARAERIVPPTRPAAPKVTRLPASTRAATCQLGVEGPAAYVVSYVIPPDDQYYTLVDPTEEGCEAQHGVQLVAAHIGVDFPYAFETPVRVGIVRADLTDPECPVPMPGQYLCPPVTQMLGAPGTGAFDIALPLAGGCTLEEKAFLEITFTEWGDWWEVPSLLLGGACAPCTSYNYYPGDDYDLCTFGFEGNPIMYVEGSPLSVVPAARGTWGRLKTMYR